MSGEHLHTLDKLHLKLRATLAYLFVRVRI